MVSALDRLGAGRAEVFVLMIVGTIPDYVQGSIKLTWALRGKRASA